MEVQLAKLTARRFYLIELQKSNLITPSINRPYPTQPLTPENLFCTMLTARFSKHESTLSANKSIQ